MSECYVKQVSSFIDSTAFIDSAIMKIRRWRYTKFAKICALPEGLPKKVSRLAIARHGGPPIKLTCL